MRSCKDTATLLTKASLDRLSLNEWLALHLHLLICRMCRYHQRQTKILSQATHQLLEARHRLMKLSDPARQRIHHAMEKSRHN